MKSITPLLALFLAFAGQAYAAQFVVDASEAQSQRGLSSEAASQARQTGGAQLSVSRSVTIFDDPELGRITEICVAVHNNSIDRAAQNVTISDRIDARQRFIAKSIRTGVKVQNFGDRQNCSGGIVGGTFDGSYVNDQAYEITGGAVFAITYRVSSEK